MYVTARAITVKGRQVPVGARLSDVYDGGPDGTYYAMVHFDGTRMKLLLRRDDFTTQPTTLEKRRESTRKMMATKAAKRAAKNGS